MSDNNQNDAISFDLPKNQSSVIKVIGVGGGGSNAVNHMFNHGIRGVDFVICNTDSQALENSAVPIKIQLGVNLTEGLGAGANPEVGEEAARESLEDIRSILGHSTKMLFITAGMGGGTGTGAAPVIAKAAKEMGILTVGIVTQPFLFEGNNRRQQAEKGIDELRNNVDSLIVINNNKLREVYGNLGFKAGFAKADEVLATAARGIAEVITHHYTTNIDLRDAKTVLADSGTAIMGSSEAKGENRAAQAIASAMDSPLLNDNHIRGAKNVLLLIVSGTEEITIDEIGEINDFIQNEAGGNANIIMGIGEDEELEDSIAVTIVATGFNADQQVQVTGRSPRKVVHPLEDEQEVSTSVYTKTYQQDREDDQEDMISLELQKIKQTKETQSSHQPPLFNFEEEDESINTEANTTQASEEQVSEEYVSGVSSDTAPNEIRHVLELEDDVVDSAPEVKEITAADRGTEETSKNEEITSGLEENSIIETEEKELEAPTAEKDDSDAEEEFTFFELDSASDKDTEVEKIEAEADSNNTTETLVEELKEVQAEQKTNEEPKAEIEQKAEESKEETMTFNLDDYLELEAKLKSPAAQKKSKEVQNKQEEDEALNFELKTVETPVKESSPVAKTSEDGISERMRLKAEERKAQFKAFNYRFKTHPYAVDDAENVPAYKRQGINIEGEKHSTENKLGRFTINEDDGEIKSNNSFLHDNVD